LCRHDYNSDIPKVRKNNQGRYSKQISHWTSKPQALKPGYHRFHAGNASFLRNFRRNREQLETAYFESRVACCSTGSGSSPEIGSRNGPPSALAVFGDPLLHFAQVATN
jgi:hypothetical protein